MEQDDEDFKIVKKEPEKKVVKEPKKYYEVKIESMLPCILSFKILADSPEEALELTKKQPPYNVKHSFIGKKDKKAKVYLSGTTFLKLVKDYV